MGCGQSSPTLAEPAKEKKKGTAQQQPASTKYTLDNTEPAEPVKASPVHVVGRPDHKYVTTYSDLAQYPSSVSTIADTSRRCRVHLSYNSNQDALYRQLSFLVNGYMQIERAAPGDKIEPLVVVSSVAGTLPMRISKSSYEHIVAQRERAEKVKTANLSDAVQWRCKPNGITLSDIRPVAGYSRMINSLAFSTDGLFLTVALGWQQVPVPQERRNIGRPEEKGEHLEKLAPSPRGRKSSTALTQRSLCIHLQNAENMEPMGTFLAKGFLEPTNSMVFSASDEKMYSCTDTGDLNTWVVTKRRSTARFNGMPGLLCTKEVKISPNGKIFGICGESRERDCNGHIVLWDLENSCMLASVERHPSKVSSFDFHPSNKLVVSGDISAIILIWKVHGGEVLRMIVGHHFPLSKIFFVNTVEMVAAGLAGEDKSYTMNSHTLCTADDKHLRAWTFPDIGAAEGGELDAERWDPWNGEYKIFPKWTRNVGGELQLHDPPAADEGSEEPEDEAAKSRTSSQSELLHDLLQHLYSPPAYVHMHQAPGTNRRRYSLIKGISKGLIVVCGMKKEV